MSTNFGDAKRTLSTGDLVISVSEIFDRLQTKVDPNTLEQLLRDILAGRRDQVRPGELITAELINQILAELESLQVRVTKLEAGGVVTIPVPVATPVEITDVLLHGTRTVGDEITVVGKNFVRPAETNQVKVGPKNVLLFKAGSDDRNLIFDIPDLKDLNLNPDGTPVAVTVQNKNGTASRDVVIRPLPTFPKGTLTVQYTNSPIVALVGAETTPTIKNGLRYDFIFTITTNVDKDATYTLAPTVTGTGWAAQVLNDADQPIRQLTIPAGPLQRLVRVRVSAPAAGSGTAASTVTLGVTESSGAGGVPPGSDQFTITVGGAVPAPNTAVSVGIRTLPADVTTDGGRLVFPLKDSTISINVGITTGGIFNVSASFRNPNGWSTRAPFITGQTLDAGSSGAARDFNVHVIATVDAQPTDLLIQVQRTSGGPDLSTTFVQPVRPAAAT
jgi:hypothetical protein